MVISKDGTLGEVYEINGLNVGLPSQPKKIETRHNKWFKEELPSKLKNLKSIFDW